MTLLLKRMIELDGRFSSFLRLRPDAGMVRRVAAILAHSGDSWFWLLGLFFVWILAGIEWHNRAALLVIGIVVQAVLVLVIKFSIRRRRPEGEWGAIYRNTDPHSFPSGHAARAGLLAVMSWGLGPFWFALAVLLWAPLVSLARVLMGVHYVSDVLAGVLVGVLVGAGILELQPLIMSLVPFLFY